MNRGVKALVKHELRPTLYTGVYFMFIVLGAIYFTNILYRLNYETYMIEPNDWIIYMQNIRIPMIIYMYVLLFFGIGILISTFMMFREATNIETNRFLKSLPYSHYHYRVKIVMGVLSYTIPYILLVIAFVGFKVKYQELFNDMQSIRLIGESLKSTDTIGHLLVLSLIYYLIITTWYLFLMMMQYLWNNAIGANIVGIIIWLTPLFIIYSFLEIYANNDYWNLNYLVTGDLILYINPFLYGLEKIIQPEYALGSGQHNVYVSVILNPSMKVIVLIGMCIVFGALTYIISQKREIEKVCYLIPSKVFRVIFRIGVAICSMLLFGILTKEIFLWRLETGFVMFQILMLIAGLIGGVIAYKISCIGIEKK